MLTERVDGEVYAMTVLWCAVVCCGMWYVRVQCRVILIERSESMKAGQLSSCIVLYCTVSYCIVL